MLNSEVKKTELEVICERYELATSTANIGVYDWDTLTDIVYYSKTWKAQVGYDEHELENNFDTWLKFLHPDESEEIQRSWMEYIENPIGVFVSEYRLHHKNGSYIWVLAKTKVLKDDDGAVSRMFGSHMEITHKKESELKLQAICNQSLEGISIADDNGKYVFVNPTFCKMSGYTEQELLELTVYDMAGNNQDNSCFDQSKQGQKIINVVLKKKNGTEYFSELTVNDIAVSNEKFLLRTLRDVSDKVKAEKDIKDNLEFLVQERTHELNSAVLRLNHEIKQRIIAEKKIQESLDLKETLLREITHRVKNNFQIICSLIRLQQRRVKSSEANELLKQTSNRIHTMALIHETLYKSNTFDDVDFKEYVRALVSYIKTISHVSSIQIIEEVCEGMLSITEATNLGMIIMELMTNSLNHAFLKAGSGEIVIRLTSLNGKHKLMVRDNGIGFPPGLDFENTESLGMQVVVSLTTQLEGSIKLLDTKGTNFEIIF
jgi:PAS domain S-box-containing protein